jgi:4-hydroxybenzoyl-CoA reductase subunit beta
MYSSQACVSLTELPMGLPKFTCLAPSDIKEACSYLEEHEGQIAILAGGTDLVMRLKRQIETPAYLLSLRKMNGLNSIQHDPDTGFKLGAMCSLTNITVNPSVKSGLSALARAAEQVASPQVRNRGTIGGNVCLDTRCWYFNRSWQWRKTLAPCFKSGGDRCYVVKGGKECYALFQADTVASLLVMKSKLRFVSHTGERLIPIEAFYSGNGQVPTLHNSGEILAEIHIPGLLPRSGTSYLKYRKRGSIDFPTLGLSCFVRLDREARSCKEVRFAFTGSGSGPLLIEASQELGGMEEPTLTEDQTGRLLSELKPVTHMGVSASLKRKLAGMMLSKAFHEAWQDAQRRDPEMDSLLAGAAARPTKKIKGNDKCQNPNVK